MRGVGSMVMAGGRRTRASSVRGDLPTVLPATITSVRHSEASTRKHPAHPRSGIRMDDFQVCEQVDKRP